MIIPLKVFWTSKDGIRCAVHGGALGGRRPVRRAYFLCGCLSVIFNGDAVGTPAYKYPNEDGYGE